MSPRMLAQEIEEPTRTGVSNSWLAILFFIGIEVMIFLMFLGSLLYLRLRGAPWPPPGLPPLDPTFPAINLGVLLLSGALSYASGWAIRRYRVTTTEKLLLATSALGVLFLAGQIREYAILFQNGITISNSLYGSLFYTTIGFHGAHVLSGIIWLLAVWYSTRQARQTPFRHFGVRAATLYWEFVAVVWIALYAMLYVL